MKIAICGYGKHGKNTVSKFIARYTGLRYGPSTSVFAAPLAFEKLATTYGYQTQFECWKDRACHRKEWYDLIVEYNKPTGIKLYQEMLVDYDIIDGIRDAKELETCRQHKLFDLILWVDASLRIPAEPLSSCTVTASHCDITILNNGTKKELYRKLTNLTRTMKKVWL